MESTVNDEALPLMTFSTTLPASGADYNKVERFIEAAILTVIFIVAVTGNILLWMVILRRNSLRTNSNALVLCLSGADLLVSLVNMPVTIFTIIQGDWIFSKSACVLLGFINMVTFIASVMSLGAISINRYILIVHASKFRNVYTKRNTAFFILGVWLISGLLAMPPLIGWANYGYLEGQSFCFCEWTKSVSYTFFMVGICFGGPCSVMTFCYYNILRAFKESQKKVSLRDGNGKRGASNATNRRGSSGSAKDRIKHSLNSKLLDPKYRRRQSLPFDSTASEDRPANEENGSLETGVDPIRRRCGTTGMIRKTRPAKSFQAYSTECVNGSNNVNTAIIINNPSEESLKSSDAAENSNRSLSHSPPPPTVTVVDLPLKGEKKPPNHLASNGSPKRWSSPFKRSKKNALQVPKRVTTVKQDSISGDDFSNPFINSVTAIEVTAQTSVNGSVSSTGRRAVPPGLYGTPHGPSSSRIARKKKRREEEMRLTKSFLVVIFVFILCWFPFCITMFWSVFIRDPTKSVPRAIDMATLLLGYANSCCNPIIYGVMNRKFRAGFKSILCWWTDPNIVSPWKPPPDSNPS